MEVVKTSQLHWEDHTEFAHCIELLNDPNHIKKQFMKSNLIEYSLLKTLLS